MSRLAIFQPTALTTGLRKNPFGKDVANLGLFQALCRYGGFEAIDIVSNKAAPADVLHEALIGDVSSPTRLEGGSILDQRRLAANGALLRGTADIVNLAWQRRMGAGDSAYSVVGLVHTLGPPAIRDYIVDSAAAPTYRWDALICTSPAVQEALGAMFDGHAEFIHARFGGDRRPRPQLPLIPLGVDVPHFEAQADRPQARAALRAELGLSDEDVLILWVGRLSFFEKAFPQSMMRAAGEAAAKTGRKVVFAMAGWFPIEPTHREMYQAAAKAYGAAAQIRFEDGNDRERLGSLWAGADVFISLVDNIQETFGITPIEAMAAGLPVVASDWDGYRYTIEDGVQGFLIPTLGGPPGGLGAMLAAPHSYLIESYQAFAGSVAQHTAVHVGKAAEALSALIASPELRRSMGAAGRERARTMFDWPVVARQYRALIEELGRVRASEQADASGPRLHPAKGDPFAEFAHFASHVLRPETPLRIRAGAGIQDLRRAQGVPLDVAFSTFRATLQECAQALELLASGRARTAGEVVARFPAARRGRIELGLVWMAKIGILDWLGD